jgi:hypothetical protein
MVAVLRTRTLSETRRFMKTLIDKKVVILRLRPPTYELGLRESGDQQVNVGGDFLGRTDLWHCPDLLRTEEWECAGRRRGAVETGGAVRPDTSRRRSRSCQTGGWRDRARCWPSWIL